MLKILDSQLEHLAAYALEQFVQHGAKRVRADMPRRAQPWSDDGLVELVRDAVARGMRYGMSSERDLGMMIDLTLIYGRGFDARDDVVRDTLMNDDLDTLAKLDAIFYHLGNPPEDG